MSVLLTILRIVWPYLAASGIGAFAAHEIDQIPYARLGAQYSAYQVKVAQEDQARAQAAQEALQAQITTRLTTEANNGKVLQSLQNERDAALAARDFSDRLLAAAAKNHAANSCSVPATPGGPAPDAAPQPSGGGQLAQLLRSAAVETAQCFEHYTGLQLQLQPQLKVNP